MAASAKRRWLWLGAPLAAALLVSGCGGETSEGAGQKRLLPNGDLQETTASLNELPEFLQASGPNVRLAYEAAAKLKDTLPYIPCYCGCGESAGHGSNLDCFISGVDESGAVTWDDHGTRCGVCQQIALQAARLKQEGRSEVEIRRYVDAAYGQGYAKGTDTPFPTA